MRDKRPWVVLCKCDCHANCPLSARKDAVPEADWSTACTCAAAEAERERLAKGRAASAERRERTRAAMREVDLEGGRSAADIQADMEAAYRRHGVEPATDLAGSASFVEAVTGPRLLLVPRLAKLGWRGLSALRQILHEDRDDEPNDD